MKNHLLNIISITKILIINFLLINLSYSNSPLLKLVPETGVYNPAESFYYLEDDTRLLDINDILSEAYQPEFNGLKQDKPNFGFSKSNFWFKIRIINKDSLNLDWLFEVPYPPLDSLSFWIYKEGSLVKDYHVGDLIPFNQRPIQHPSFVIPIHLKTDQIYEVYIRVKTESSVLLPISLKREDIFYPAEKSADVGYGIFYGALFFIMIYNLFIYFTLRDRSYLFYVCSTLSSTLFLASLVGHSFQYLWSGLPWWANKALPFFMGSWGLFSALFARDFLETDKYIPKIHKALYFNLATGGLSILLTFVAPYHISARFAAATLAIDVIIMLIAGISSWKAQHKVARYYIMAWSMLLFGTFIIIFRNFGILPYNFITTHAVEIGSLMEATLLSLALSDKYSLMRKEKEDAQVKALALEKQYAEELEGKIHARTAELEAQKKATEEEHALVSAKNLEIEFAFKEIARKNEKIQSSIRYAQRIQQAILPFHHHFASAFQDYFIFYKSKELVSGDFYWIHQRENFVLTSAVDCTGHGIPGAFMSMVGHTLLEQIVSKSSVFEADKILNELHIGIRSALQQANSDNRDGMDIALCVINRTNKEVQFAGARNPLYIVENNEFKIIEGDRMHIGGIQNEDERVFTKHTIQATSETRFYICSDGYEDQFGEVSGTKFYRKRFRDLLLKIHPLPMRQQRTEIRENLTQWMGKEKQTDDILVMGFMV
jgi:serine phosphatase RsbU (regulator of sigma subunit)